MKQILIIDDEEDIREIAQASLEIMRDWTVITVSSGAEGIAKAKTAQPDAILLDFMLPDMDGATTLQQLKANPTTCGIPVILLTAKVRAADRSCFAGINVAAIVAKPFNPEDLADQIAEALGWDALE
jgi:CheY-like chemotaxis protein